MPPNNPDDKFFIKHNVPPPSHELHGSEEEIATNLSRPSKHEWRQMGSRLYCIGCPSEHATEPRFTDYILTGTDDKGEPVLHKIGT